jgi:hypothetical protein
MAPLMENIAETLSKRVREGIRLSEVLAMDIRQSRKLVQEAKDVLTSWSENYFRMRKRIEDTGSLIVANTPEQFAAQMKAEFEVYKKVVDSAGLKLE